MKIWNNDNDQEGIALDSMDTMRRLNRYSFSGVVVEDQLLRQSCDQLMKDEMEEQELANHYDAHYAATLNQHRQIAACVRVLKRKANCLPLFKRYKIFNSDLMDLLSIVGLGEVSDFYLAREFCRRSDDGMYGISSHPFPHTMRRIEADIPWNRAAVPVHLCKALFQLCRVHGMTHVVLSADIELIQRCKAYLIPFREIGPMASSDGRSVPVLFDMEKINTLIKDASPAFKHFALDTAVTWKTSGFSLPATSL